MKLKSALAVLSTLALAAASTLYAFADSAQSLSRQAKVSLQEAEDTALKEVPGRTKRIEMEWDDGVLIYQFEICTAKKKMEVRINAASGSVMKVDKQMGFCGDDEKDRD